MIKSYKKSLPRCSEYYTNSLEIDKKLIIHKFYSKKVEIIFHLIFKGSTENKLSLKLSSFGTI